MTNVISFSLAETVFQPKKPDKCCCCAYGTNGIYKIFYSHLQLFWIGRSQTSTACQISCFVKKLAYWDGFYKEVKREGWEKEAFSEEGNMPYRGGNTDWRMTPHEKRHLKAADFQCHDVQAKNALSRRLSIKTRTGKQKPSGCCSSGVKCVCSWASHVALVVRACPPMREM